MYYLKKTKNLKTSASQTYTYFITLLNLVIKQKHVTFYTLMYWIKNYDAVHLESHIQAFSTKKKYQNN